MLNHVVLMGRIVRDVELKRTGTGTAVATFTVAVDRDYKSASGERETDFLDCVAWRQTAEFISNYFHKGSPIAVSGRLGVRTWNDKEGNKRKAVEVAVDNAYFAGDRNTDGGGRNNSGYNNGSRRAGAPQDVRFEEVSADESELPF